MSSTPENPQEDSDPDARLDEALSRLRMQIAAEDAPARLVELARQLEAAARRRAKKEPDE